LQTEVNKKLRKAVTLKKMITFYENFYKDNDFQ